MKKMKVIVPEPVTGSGHAADNKPCQDRVIHFSGTLLGSSVTIIGLADGAGSVSHSHIGAERVLDLGKSELTEERLLSSIVRKTKFPRLFSSLSSCRVFGIKTYEQMWPAVANDVVQEMQAELTRQSEQIGVSKKQLATTVILALIIDDFVFALRVGDGALAVQTTDGSIQSAFPPKTNSYINETSFITSRDYQVECAIFRNVESILATTDGCEPFFFNQMTGEPQSARLESFFKVAKNEAAESKIAAWLNSPTLRQITQDDLSLVIATRKTNHDNSD